MAERSNFYLEQPNVIKLPNSGEHVYFCLKLTQTPGLCILTEARCQAECFSIVMILTSEIIETRKQDHEE